MRLCVHYALVDTIILCARVSPQASQQSSPQAVWVVPALRQLHEITRSFIKQTYQKQDKVKQTRPQTKKHHRKRSIVQSVQCCSGKLPLPPRRASSKTWRRTLRSSSWSRDHLCAAIDWLWPQVEITASQAQLWLMDDTPIRRSDFLSWTFFC